MSIVAYVITIIVVVASAFFTTRYLSTMYTKGLNSRHIKVIEKINLAADKSLWLIAFGEKHYFLYTDKLGMTKLDEVNHLQPLPDKEPSEFIMHKTLTEIPKTFSDILEKVKKRGSNEK